VIDPPIDIVVLSARSSVLAIPRMIFLLHSPQIETRWLVVAQRYAADTGAALPEAFAVAY
jgi:hypothetical protein